MALSLLSLAPMISAGVKKGRSHKSRSRLLDENIKFEGNSSSNQNSGQTGLVQFFNRQSLVARLKPSKDRNYKAALADFLEATAGSMRTGAGLLQALKEAQGRTEACESLNSEVSEIVHLIESGMTASKALIRWQKMRWQKACGPSCVSKAAIALTFESGSNQARGIDNVAAGIRAELGHYEEVQALSAQARISGLVIALMPIGFLAIVLISDPGVLSFLFTQPLGWVCLVLGVGLDVLGAVWMKRILNKALGPVETSGKKNWILTGAGL